MSIVASCVEFKCFSKHSCCFLFLPLYKETDLSMFLLEDGNFLLFLLIVFDLDRSMFA